MQQAFLKYELDISRDSTWMTVTVSKQAKNSLLYVQELGKFYAGPNYFTERQALASYMIQCTLDGEGELFYNNEHYPIRKQQLYWIDCQNYQYYNTSRAAGKWDKWWVHFYGEGARAYYDLFLAQNDGKNVLTLPSNNRFWERMDLLFSSYHDGAGDLIVDVEASGIITEIMIEIIHAAALPMSNAQIPQSITGSREYLLNHFHEQISLEDLSKRFHMNKYHFLRQFKRYVGQTPNEFLIQTRLNKAKELLRTTDLGIGNIGLSVGIPNTSHFINLFKKHEMMTPASYRQSWYRAC